MSLLKSAHRARWVIAFVFAACTARPTQAQCPPDWRPGEPFPGTNGVVRAIVDWDPDGDGPAPALLVVGGTFTAAGSIPAQNIAAWDGTSWHALADGVTSNTECGPLCGAVMALAVYRGDLVVGGSFETAGSVAAPGIACWDGARWSSVGSGVGFTEAPFTGTVNSLLVSKDLLFAGGSFSMAGGVPAANLATWDGAKWQAAGPGTAFPIQAMVLHDGAVVAGGITWYRWWQTAAVVVEWTGERWDQLLLHEGGWLRTLASFEGTLVAGGSFVGGSALAWTGSEWIQFGEALGSLPCGGSLFCDTGVLSLVVHEGKLIAGGRFDMDGLHPNANLECNIAIWNGQAWTPLAAELEASGVKTLGTHGGDLVVGLESLSQGGTTFATGVATFTGVEWEAIGAASPPLPSIGAILRGGESLTVSHLWMYRPVRAWNGVAWTTLGEEQFTSCCADVDDSDRGGDVNDCYNCPGLVRALHMHDGQLIALGGFSIPGLPEADGVARWDGKAWASLGTGLPPTTELRAAATHNDQLFVGGRSYSLGGPIVARWDGAAWSLLGGGLGPAIGAKRVIALEVHQGDLVAGGSFTTAGGAAIGHIARWNGSSWLPLGSGLDGDVLALAIFGDDLIAGGSFSHAGGVPAANIARWDGRNWSPLGSGTDGTVSSHVVHEGQLFAAGDFGDAGGFTSNRIARWDGVTWHALGAGVEGFVWSLSSDGADLLVGGEFDVVGDTVSRSVARWGPSCGPTDLNGDGAVNATDLAILLGAWGSCGSCANCPADLTGDCTIGAADLSVLLGAWTG